jgi:hypothetical protein
MPVPQQVFLTHLGNPLSVVRLELEFPVVADVGEVCRDVADLPPAACHFHHDLGRPSYGAPDLLDLADL